MKKYFGICTAILLASANAYAYAADEPLSPGFNPFSTLIAEEKENCPETPGVQILCAPLLDQTSGLLSQTVTPEQALDSLKMSARTSISNTDFPNDKTKRSAANSALTPSLPLSLEFKDIDRENSASVIGLEYNIDYTIEPPQPLQGLNYNLNFKSEGTITKTAAENPRNFIDSKLEFSGYRHSMFGSLTDDEGETLQALATEAASRNESARITALDLIAKTLAPLNGYYFVSYGVEAGIESDQEFNFTNKKLGGYLFGKYDFWNRRTLLGRLGVTTGLRLGVQNIDPSDETPRAIAGDNSDYMRASAEAALAVPLGSMGEHPLVFVANYRAYREISASNTVKSANLDRYLLRTFALQGPYGMYVSFSSGRQPFDLTSEDTVEIGLKWYPWSP